MDPSTLKKLNIERDARRAFVLLTDLGDGRDRMITTESACNIPGALGAAIQDALQSGKSGKAEINGRDYFLNVHIPAVRIVVIGAVHISQALAVIASATGYHIEIIDPREAFASPDRFSGVALNARWPDEVLADNPLDEFCALVAVTHDPKIDDVAIKLALDAGCFYIGALGSKKSHAKRLQRLVGSGCDAIALERISGPIGLNIGAANPNEIAVSIMAEIISCLRHRA